VKIRYRVTALASALAIAAAMGVTLAGAASANSVTICDGNGHCWTGEGRSANLALTGATVFDTNDTANCQSNAINGTNRETCAYQASKNNCVSASLTGKTTLQKCDPENTYQQFWYTPSHAIYSVGVSNQDHQDWCEIDTNGDVQNARCPAASSQPADMTFHL
jgi:spore germination protein YaaH